MAGSLDPAAGADLADVPVVAVASGKGGVGKTTAAVNLALALSASGVRVGLVDADLYGPDAAHMMGVRRRQEAAHVTVFAPQGAPGAQLQAIERHGVQLASAAFLMGESQGLGVGAPIAELLIHRLLTGTSWADVDCLIVDLPPGTADVQQLVFRFRRRLFVLLVVTPQIVAHRDACRLLDSLTRSQAVTLGGIENMAGQICPHCGETTPLFPPAPPDEAIWSKVAKLASVPFSARAAQDADLGQPVMLTRSVPQQVAAYEQVAAEVRAALRGGGHAHPDLN